VDFFQLRQGRLLSGMEESESDGLDGDKLMLLLVQMGGMGCSGASCTWHLSFGIRNPRVGQSMSFEWMHSCPLLSALTCMYA